MSRRNEVPLRIELFSGSDDSPFLIHSRKEIQFILHAIAQKSHRVALYYDEGNSFILTTVLAVDEHGLWLEAGPNARDNKRLQQSKKIFFISSHQQAKIQFVSHHTESVTYKDIEAVYLPLPDTLLRIQRRDYYRLVTPVTNPLKCIIPVTPELVSHKREITIMDISSGGVALICETEDTELLPGRIYPDCKIHLPDDTTVVATIEVKNAFSVTSPKGIVQKRAGCQFLNLDGRMEIQLQRYINQLQLQQHALR